MIVLSKRVTRPYIYCHTSANAYALIYVLIRLNALSPTAISGHTKAEVYVCNTDPINEIYLRIGSGYIKPVPRSEPHHLDQFTVRTGTGSNRCQYCPNDLCQTFDYIYLEPPCLNSECCQNNISRDSKKGLQWIAPAILLHTFRQYHSLIRQ